MVAESPVLSSSVLLLNRLYMALRVVSAKRAMTMVYRELAEVVAVEDGQYLSYDFNDWLASSMIDESMPAAQRGELLYSQQGCVTCHSIDGSIRLISDAIYLVLQIPVMLIYCGYLKAQLP